ncbi:hypothetical protein MASR2M78_11170 [Treponema sp.]
MKKAGDLLNAFFDEQTLTKAGAYSELFSAWRSLVNERIAAHSKIVELERDILIVEADHPGWIQVLQFKQADILKAAQKRFPDLSIHGISLRLARSTGYSEIKEQDIEPKNEEPRDTELPLETEKVSTSGSAFDRIDDDSFKETLKRLEKGIKERARQNKGR